MDVLNLRSNKNVMKIFLSLISLMLVVGFADAQKQVAVKPNTKKQTIDGFGGSIAYYENWVVSHPKRTMIYDYLFRDLGLSILRSRNMYMNEGCIFMPTEQTVFDKKLAKNVKVASYAKAFNAVYDTLAKYKSSLNMYPKMIGSEVLGIENAWSGRPGDYTKYMDMSKCYAVAHHLYTGTDAATMVTNMTVLNNAYPTIPKMQTEYSDKDWFTLSQIIHNSLVYENVSAYLVWEIIWPGSDFIDMENPWTSGSWVNTNGFKVGTKYYAFKQFANFIKPGYNPAKSITTIALQVASQISGIPTNPREENLVLAFPNPFSSEVTLNLKDFSANAVVEVSNLSGQVLYREKIENITSGKIGSELATGLYILGITDGDKRITSKI